MPIKKSAFKHQRQTIKRTVLNKAAKERMRTTLKNARKAIVAKDKTKATDAVKKAIKILDKSAQHKLIKKNTASRYKSRLMKQLATLGK